MLRIQRMLMATILAIGGAADAELMARAGHGNKAAVQIYRHSTLDRDRRIAKRMSRLADAKPGCARAGR